VTGQPGPPGAAGRPLPLVWARTEPFWTGGAEGRLVVQRCPTCRRIMHPPGIRCPHDGSLDLAWEPVSGAARLETWTVNLHQWFPGIEPPYVVALVALLEDPTARILTNVVGVDHAELREGMDLRVTFHGVSDEEGTVWLPCFTTPDPVVAPADGVPA